MRVARRDRGGVEPDRHPRAGVGGLDAHVGGGEELFEPGPVGLVVEVEHRAALVAVPIGEVGGGPVDDRWEAPPRGPAGWLDEHHVGAEVGQHPATQVATPVGQVDDAEAAQRQVSSFGQRTTPLRSRAAASVRHHPCRPPSGDLAATVRSCRPRSPSTPIGTTTSR